MNIPPPPMYGELYPSIENFLEWSAEGERDALSFSERLYDLLDGAYLKGYEKAQEDNADAIDYYHGTGE